MALNFFNNLTTSWFDIASSLTNEHQLESHIIDKFELSEKIFEHINPLSIKFIETVLGESNKHYDSNINYAFNINRLFKTKKNDNMSSEASKKLKELIKETFLFGSLTQLYLFNFPTREKYANVDINKLGEEWLVDAVVADKTMGYYGDKQNPICMDIWKSHFQNSVRGILKKDFKVNIF